MPREIFRPRHTTIASISRDDPYGRPETNISGGKSKPWKKGSPGNPPRNRQKDSDEEAKPVVFQPEIVEGTSSQSRASRWDDVPTDVYSRDPFTGEYGWRTVPPAALSGEKASQGESSGQSKKKKSEKPKKFKGPGKYSGKIIRRSSNISYTW